MYLRPLTPDDSKDFFYSAWDEDVCRYLPGFYCNTEEKARSIIEKLLSSKAVKPYVIHTPTCHFIGLIVAVNNGNKKVEISYFINQRFRHQGYASMALEQLLKDYKGFTVYFDIDERNRKSFNIIKKYKPIRSGYYYIFENN